jgi:hypothetical protein
MSAVIILIVVAGMLLIIARQSNLRKCRTLILNPIQASRRVELGHHRKVEIVVFLWESILDSPNDVRR